MGILRKRKIPLAIRKGANDEYPNKKSYRSIKELNESGDIPSCHTCKSSEHVRPNGSNKGNRKFICDNPLHERPIYFSTTTSYEAILIYCWAMIENLCLLACTNSKTDGITKFDESSKYFLEFGLQLFLKYINEHLPASKIHIKNGEDIVAVFFDSTGSRIIKNKGIILAKIGDQIMFQIISCSNYMSAYAFVREIKKQLVVSDKTKIVFVTDGEVSFVDPVKEFFPEATHIRQFHGQRSKGIIYIHLKDDKKDYTIRCLWDLVLNEGTASEKTIKMRERKAKQKLEQKERKSEKPKIQYSKLSKDIMIWEGTVYEPRGVRRIIRNKSKKKTTKNNGENTEKVVKEKETQKRDNEFVTSTDDTPKLIYKGNLEGALKISVMLLCFNILKKIFGGLYITSNIVEIIFNFKSQLYPHRTIKYGERLLICVLYNYMKLKEETKEELINFFKKVVTYDLVMKYVLYGTGEQNNKIDRKQTYLEIINSAFKAGKQLYIHYRDRFHKHTARVVTPKRIIENEYNAALMLEGFCHKRNEKRTFYLDRIKDIALTDAFSSIRF